MIDNIKNPSSLRLRPYYIMQSVDLWGLAPSTTTLSILKQKKAKKKIHQ